MLTLFTVILLGLCPPLLASPPAAENGSPHGGSHAISAPSFRIYTEDPGLYRVTFEQLAAAGLGRSAVPASSVALSNRGRVVPLRLEDGGDGELGPGDWFEFAAEVVHGESTYYHSHARHNVYWLEWREDLARRLGESHQSLIVSDGAETVQLQRELHLERDRLLIRLAAADVDRHEEPELWYWDKITHLDQQPFTVDLDLSDARKAAPLELEVGMRGLSTASNQQRNHKDHSVRFSGPNGPLATAAWNGRGPYVHTRRLANLSSFSTVAQGQLAVTIQPRSNGDEDLIDVVMIDFVKLKYTHSGTLSAGQIRLTVPPASQGGIVELLPSVDGPLTVLGTELGFIALEAKAGERLRLRLPPTETQLWLRLAEAPRAPVAIEVDHPSSLRSFARQADYLMIAHSSLLDATRELAELHRRRGLSVALIDVQDVYDEFGDGLPSPAAIREFVAHAYHNYRSPRPRFVLLVGDASWDTKNATVDDSNYANWVGRQLLRGRRFVAKDTDDYDSALVNDRNLIPSWNYHTAEGHAASDTYYTQVAGDDELPDLALGRLPVASPQEVKTIIDKVRRYVEDAPLGPWRSRLVWITGALTAHQTRTHRLAEQLTASGHPPVLIIPGEEARAEDRTRIIDAMNSGNLVTHFIGHGGRFIWRTGPPDLADQTDLFGLDELESLAVSDRLPVVLSVSCYSAPFDHPSADSIGEAFLRQPERGAIAFIGASWRNAPPRELSRLLVEALARPGTIGEALLAAKRQMRKLDPIHLFNLLGDPAVPVNAPQNTLQVDHRINDGQLLLSFELPATAVGGQLALDYLDAGGAVVSSESIPAESAAIELVRELNERVQTVTVYYWNDETGIDGVGAASLPSVEQGTTAP